MILSTFLITSNTYYIKYFFPIRIFDFVTCAGPGTQQTDEPRASNTTYLLFYRRNIYDLVGWVSASWDLPLLSSISRGPVDSYI